MAEPVQEHQNLQHHSSQISPLQEYPRFSRFSNGIIKGLGLVHAIPSSLVARTDNQDLGNKTSRLEKLSAGVTVLTQGAVYYLLARKGIPAYYIPVATNMIDAVGLGTYYRLMRSGLVNATPVPPIY